MTASLLYRRSPNLDECGRIVRRARDHGSHCDRPRRDQRPWWGRRVLSGYGAIWWRPAPRANLSRGCAAAVAAAPSGAVALDGWCLGAGGPQLSLAAYAAGTATLFAGLVYFQRSPDARLTNVPTAVTLTVATGTPLGMLQRLSKLSMPSPIVGFTGMPITGRGV